jgi:WD40 repeat protein
VWVYRLRGSGFDENGTPLPGPKAGSVESLAFDPKGRLLAAAYFKHGTVQLWNRRTAKPAGVLHMGSGTVDSLAFSPDGRILAGAGAGGTLRLWDVRTLSQLGPTLLSPVNTLNAIAFSPDGLTLAGAGEHGTVVWSGILWENDRELASRVCSLLSGNLTQGQWKTLVAGRIGYRTTCPG